MGLKERVTNFFTGNPIEEESEGLMESSQEEAPIIRRRNSNNVIKLHNSAVNARVEVCEPKRFEEAKDMADFLKNRKHVIVNFENTPADISQRIIDFVSGTVYALDGQSQQVGKNIFLFVPENVEINRDTHLVTRKYSVDTVPETGGF